MSQFEKLLFKLLSGKSDNNFTFEEVRNLLVRLNFESRVKGSHYIFYKAGIDEILNIQSLNGKAKAYQVKQIRNLILKYKL